MLILGWTFTSGRITAATRIWTGAGGDGLWNNPVNWDSGLLPQVTDDILLDNSRVPINYTVNLPNSIVTIHSIIIRPSANQTIELVLPSTNLIENGFSVIGPGEGLTLERGAIFLNASGLTSGESILVADSIRINNGGKYVHHTRAAHANNIVRILSTAPGTETGIFEFDVPRAAYTISASNRKYGSLVLRSVASGGATSYTCNGSNTLTINGNLQIEQGVNFSVDLGGSNGNILIGKDLIQNGGIFNLASGMGNTTVVRIAGSIIQSVGSTITETNTGLPTIELNGVSTQVISLQGGIQNSVNFRMNNQEGAILLSPVQLPYKLELWQGRITSSAINLLTLMPNCSVQVDSSAANTSYIDGPMKKIGLQSSSHFLFPVGKNGILRWVELQNVNGDFTVEYVKSNPRLFSISCSPGIDHVSSQEYWQIVADKPGSASAKVELSFQDPGSGGVTDITTLRVAALRDTIWNDEGQTAYSGTFGTAGSVVSNTLSDFSGLQYFTLASSLNLENPLPLILRKFVVYEQWGMANISWSIEMPEEADQFEIMQGKSESELDIVQTILASPSIKEYNAKLPLIKNTCNFFELRIKEKDGHLLKSKFIAINVGNSEETVSLYPTIVHSETILNIVPSKSSQICWMALSLDGRISARGEVMLEKGRNCVLLNLSQLTAGNYLLLGTEAGEKIFLKRFIKQ
jgi:hypothetical protein